MSVSVIDGYLTKKEIEEKFQRSHRSLTRDFSNAVRVGDLKVLPHLKLRTDDGDEIVGTEVTLEKIQELSNSGLSPTWYAKREWVAERYAKGVVKTKSVTQEEGSNLSSVEERPVVTASNGELVSTLRSQIVRLEKENDRRADEHRQDKESFVEQIKMFKDMFDTLKDDHTDTKGLLKEVHQVMGKFADVSLLGSQVKPSGADGAKSETAEQEIIVDVENDSTVEAVIVEEPQKTSVKQTGKKTSKKKTAAKPKTKKRSQAKRKSTSHKWYETPTLNRLISKSPRN